VTRFAPISVQNPTPMLTALGAPELPQSEDCLTLTVSTPAVDDAARPVMVWIHGGGFVGGQGSAPLYDGTRLAVRGDVVVVTINYRLGALGFLHLGELDPALASSGCNGILDQVAALGWVRDNIASFGGDPANVTIFGASAGGASVGTLLTLPCARGLFHRAIAQSGAGHFALTRERAAARARRFCELTSCSTVDDLRVIETATILDAQAKLGIEVDAEPITCDGEPAGTGFEPVVDGALLDAAPIDRARRGDIGAVPLLIGTTDEEWRLFGLVKPAPDSDTALAARFTPLLDDAGSVSARYRIRLGADAPVADVHDAMMTDLVFRVPMHRLADASASAGNATWLYRFAYRTPIMGGALGACHSLEVPFVFDNRDGLVERFVGEDSPDSLADAMQRAWLAFARYGDPNHDGIPHWEPQRGDRRPVIRFDEQTTMTESPEADELAAWDGVL
jgi:para-nitrobenzyl esterase